MNNKATVSDTLEKTFIVKSGNSTASSLKLDTKLGRSKIVCENEMDLTTTFLLGNSSCCPFESVFLIDHLMELLALNLDRKTLLNCRLLSSRWAYFCSKELQKKIVTVIFVARQLNRPPVRAEDLVIMKSLHDHSVNDLIAVMDNSTTFPSISIVIYSSLGYYNLDKFLNSHGHFVKKYKKNGMVTIEEIRQLLLNQAPNLEVLMLKSVVIQIPEHYPQSYYSTKLREAWTGSYIFDAFTTIQYPIFKKLQVFECNSRLLEIFVQQLLYCSPNLIEVSLPEEYLHNLVQPVDRVHLLKELNLGFRFSDFHPLDYVLNYYPDRLGLRRISFTGSFYYPEFPTNAYLASLDFMRKLLNASTATCEKLEWHGIVKHFEIPRMNQVTHIVFQIDIVDGRVVSVFENGVILEDTFPNLKILEVQSDEYIGPLVSVRNFFGIYDNEPAPVLGVTNVIMNNFRGSQRHNRDMRQVFPNAYIHGLYVSMLPIRNRVK